MINKRNAKILILTILLAVMLALWGCGDNNDDPEQDAADDMNDPEVSDEDPEDEDNDTGEDEEPADDSEDEPEEDDDSEEDPESRDDSETEEDLESIFANFSMPESLSYEITVTSEEIDEHTSQFWIKGEKIRTEAEFEGQSYITIQDEEYLYSLDPQTMTGIKMPMDMNIPDQENPDEDFRADDLLEDPDFSGLTLLRSETIDGMDTYVISDTTEGYDQTLWIHKEYGIPVRMEAEGNQPEDRYVMVVSNIEVDNISDELFEPSEDYEITEMGQ